MNTMTILSFLLLSAVATTSAAVLDDINFFSIISSDTQGQGAYRCGASLIHPDIILTASFCALPGDVIRIGYKNDTYSHTFRTSTLVQDHPEAGGVQNEILANDLALVKLNQSVMDILPLAINKDRSEPTDTHDAVYFAHAGQVPDYMPIFNLGIIPLSATPEFSTEVQTGQTKTVLMRGSVGCMKAHREHAKANKQGYKPLLDEAVQFCAPSNVTAGPCDANAWGSPLWFMNGTGDTVQAGIASQGGCNPGSPPYLYTRVSHYYDWIQLTICRLSDIKPEDCAKICKEAPGGCD